MGFADRAVDACLRDWSEGQVVETHIRDVLRCRKVDVTRLEEFLCQDHPEEVRWAAARILSEKGRISEVVKAAMLVPPEDREGLLGLLSILGKQEAGLTILEGLLSSGDTMVRDAAVEMFRRAGQVDSLFPLIFDEDDNVMRRIKRYIDEAGQCGTSCSSRGPA